jgi:hypothetical protein
MNLEEKIKSEKVSQKLLASLVNQMAKEIKKGEIIIYQSPDKKIKIDVSLDKETIWLDAHKIAKIFDVNRSAIVKHINNILDIILSVGYRELHKI